METKLLVTPQPVFLHSNEFLDPEPEIVEQAAEIKKPPARTRKPPRGHDKSEHSLNKGNYRELIKMFKKYDLEFSNLLYNSKTFSGVSKTIQNELIESISYILSNVIESEIQETICFLPEADETTDISCHSQLLIVVQVLQTLKQLTGNSTFYTPFTLVNLPQRFKGKYIPSCEKRLLTL
ncbi:unnamed protein product [Diabrotica balteata]|uniref:Uncharacterized protein n=1 Tax=Diabrotica balteata TaxID=107213 RepID=A0A9N9SQ17_DIABA|nr:unnamed protein product [Diabrotica balteata]